MSLSTAAVADRSGALTPSRAAFALVAFATLLHLLVAGRVAFSVDEAHYALYAWHLDWSYFDHPPLVGWLQALMVPFATSEFALRLWPILLSVLSSLVLYRLARALFPDESPWIPAIAVVALQSAVVFQLVSFAMVPEDPLLLFGLLSALFLHRAVSNDRLVDWIGLGLAVGLAGLSKYTAVVLVFSAFAVLVTERRLVLLGRPGPWIATALAAAIVLPVFYWNAQHEWISIAYQWGHGAPERAWSVVRLLRSAAAQLLAIGGLVAFGTIALAVALREWRHPGVRFSLLLSLPALLIFAVSAGLQETLPHWTLLGWALAAPLAARWVVAHWRARGVRVGAVISAGYALVLVLAIHTQFFHPWVPFSPYQHPLADLYGWREAGVRAAELGRKSGLPLMVSHWTHASRIAWYARTPVQVLDGRKDQFDLWYGTPVRGAAALLVLPERQLKRRDNGLDRFERCEERDSLSYVLDAQPVHTFFFFECRGYRGQA